MPRRTPPCSSRPRGYGPDSGGSVEETGEAHDDDEAAVAAHLGNESGDERDLGASPLDGDDEPVLSDPFDDPDDLSDPPSIGIPYVEAGELVRPELVGSERPAGGRGNEELDATEVLGSGAVVDTDELDEETADRPVRALDDDDVPGTGDEPAPGGEAVRVVGLLGDDDETGEAVRLDDPPDDDEVVSRGTRRQQRPPPRRQRPGRRSGWPGPRAPAGR